jgi:hypothetical protein
MSLSKSIRVIHVRIIAHVHCTCSFKQLFEIEESTTKISNKVQTNDTVSEERHLGLKQHLK